MTKMSIYLTPVSHKTSRVKNNLYFLPLEFLDFSSWSHYFKKKKKTQAQTSSFFNLQCKNNLSIMFASLLVKNDYINYINNRNGKKKKVE